MLIIADLLPRLRRPDFGQVRQPLSDGLAEAQDVEGGYLPRAAPAIAAALDAARREGVSR